jgi:GWxTD domain-containing protein
MSQVKMTAAFALAAVLVLASCASARIEKQLDPKSRDFVSKVRYIITPEERKAFLALAPEAREPFIEDFWKRRDPAPATPENEYKAEYFSRIEQANRLFSGGGAPGWLQDRGRVFITLGPPDHRETYPRGITFYGSPTEIWWYGFFPITFIDERWVDDYRLDPASAVQLTMINRTQKEWNEAREAMPKGGLPYATALPGLEVKVDKAEDTGAHIALSLPYKNIWLKSRGDRFEANLEVTMKVVDAAGTEAWTFAKAFPLDIAQSGLKSALAGDFTAEADAPLGPGSYTLTVTVTNTNDGSKASVERKFEL